MFGYTQLYEIYFYIRTISPSHMASYQQVLGLSLFYYNAADQKWHTGRLTLNAPSTYHTAFTLSLPEGITEETGKTQVRPGESFSLVSSAKPSDQVPVELSAAIPWMDPNLKVYAADSSVTASHDRGFQNMIGAVIHQEDISMKKIS